MSKKAEIKTRIEDATEQRLEAYAHENGLSRAKAVRSLLDRALDLAGKPVIVRPTWSERDLEPIVYMREPVNKLHRAVTELRKMAMSHSDDKKVRADIATLTHELYAEYVRICDIKDALLSLTATEVELIRETRKLMQEHPDPGPEAQAIIKLVTRLGL